MSIETKHTDSKQWILCAPVIQYVAIDKLSGVKHVSFCLLQNVAARNAFVLVYLNYTVLQHN